VVDFIILIIHKKKGIKKMTTEEDARHMFNNLRDDDEHFDTQWGCNDHEQQEILFL
jgi:hypothetical protein